MTVSRNAIGNLINRYRAVLKKCFLLNMFGTIVVAGTLALGGSAGAALNISDTADGGVLISGGTLPDGTYETSKNIAVGDGSLVLGSTADNPATISTTGKMTLSGGDISVITSGDKISGALQMRPDNNKSPAVVPGTTNTFIPNNDPALKPAVHTLFAKESMSLQGTAINLGAPRVAGGAAPSPADIAKSWEGTRLDLRTDGNMSIQSGDFRVANIAFPIKSEPNAALRFDAGGTLNVSGGTFTLEGQAVANPARKNYDGPSLMSLKAQKDLVIDGGTFDIKSARLHLNSTDGKVIINNGEFNIDNTSPYPAWQTFDVVNGQAVVRPQASNTQDKYGVFGSLDTTSELEVNGGVFNIGSENSYPGANYINMANKRATLNGGTFNLYGSGNFGNNKADLIINGGTYNMTNGGSFGGRNTNGPAVVMSGGDYNFIGNGMIYVATEADYLEKADYNRTSISISGGTFSYGKFNDAKMETGTLQADYSLDISGGDFVRKADGLNSTTAIFTATGQKGSLAEASGNLNISGGTFRTEQPVNYAQDIVISRDDNIRLYNKNDYDAASQVYKLHTAQSVDDVFAQGDAAVREAFAPAHDPDALPTKAEVMAALNAANSIAAASKQEAWKFSAARDINVTGGTFQLNTVNASTISAGKNLNWDGGTLVASGGGGDVNLIGKEGINIKSGSIKSFGSEDGKPFALKYDDRGRLNRDRWTLGGYVNFKTDGDMIIGEKGTAGPEIYYSEGMLGFMKATDDGKAPGNIYLNSGSITLDGQFRSTLTLGNLNTVIDGGTLNIITSDAINRNGLDSASMWTLPMTMKSGAINLYNSQIISTGTFIEGGTVTMLGDSALTGNVGVLDIKNATVNVGDRSYIGAIRGDSLALSPYVTYNGDINIASSDLNFSLTAPGAGTALTVGKHVGGIYATETGAKISIADSTAFTFNNIFDLDSGSYAAEGFVESKAGTVSMNTFTVDMPFYSAAIAKTSDSKADLTLNVKDTQAAFNALSNNENVRNNALAFRNLARNAKDTQIGGVMSTLFNTPDARGAAEGFRQVANENALGGMFAARSNMDAFRNQLTENGSFLGNGFATSVDVGQNSRLWINGMGDWAKTRDKNGITGFDTTAGGFALGYDYTASNNKLRFGVGLGYLDSTTESNDNLTKVDGDTWYGALYTAANLDPVYIDFNVSYGRTDNDLKTKIRMPGLRGQNDASFDTETWAASLQGSYQFKFNEGATVVAPYVGVEYLSVRQGSFTESGILPRDVDGIHEEVFTVPVGVRAKHTFVGDGFTVTPEAGIAYARDLNGFRPVAHTSYGAGGYLDARGVDAGKDAMRLDVGVTTSLGDSIDLFARYDLEMRDRYTNNQITAGLKYKF